MKEKLIFLLGALLFYDITFAQNENYKEQIATGFNEPVIKDLKAVENSLSFCVIGDWGRYGAFYQKAVAAQMSSAMVGIDGSFIISTGDNFYPKGVVSDRDPIWKESFEDVYNTLSLHEDWYVVLGNHDYKTNPDAEVAYSKVSARWHMPARYFNVKKNIEKNDTTQTAEFFYIDSSPFQKDYYKDEEYAANVKGSDTAAQKRWLTAALKKSTATWKIVIGHHPLYSAGKRKGKTGDMENAFKPLFEKYKVDAYFCGHEHHLEYDSASGVHFAHFISGAGSEATPVKGADYAKFAVQDFGFMTVSLTAAEMLVQIINYKGEILYTTIIKKQK